MLKYQTTLVKVNRLQPGDELIRGEDSGYIIRHGHCAFGMRSIYIVDYDMRGRHITLPAQAKARIRKVVQNHDEG